MRRINLAVERVSCDDAAVGDFDALADSGGREDRFQALLDAVSTVVADTDVATVVRTIVDSAAGLVDADYGVCALLGPDGDLSDLVHHGVDAETAARISASSDDGGLLDLILTGPDSLRISDLSRAEGVPSSAPHPAMHSLLGLPIRVRGQLFGVLYLTRGPGRPAFSPEDERCLRELAGPASVAISNARAFEVGRRREQWLETLASVATALMSGRELPDVLQAVVRQARDIVDADCCAIAMPANNPDALTLQEADGIDAQRVIGIELPIEHTLVGSVFRFGGTVEMEDTPSDKRLALRHPLLDAMGPTIYVALGSADDVRGVLLAFNRTGRPMFERHAITMLEAFAAQVAVSLELAERRHDATRLALVEDRERIARDLHDVVIQRLFAIGLTLEGASRSITDQDAGPRVSRAVDELDETIKEIRTTIFGLQEQVDGESSSLRARAVAVVDQAVSALGFTPSLRFEGLLDTKVPARLSEQVLAVLREALSNAARHAHSTQVSVLLAVHNDMLTLTVDDDGVGMTDTGRRSGVRNMEVRAQSCGGQMKLLRREPSGTRVEWSAPLQTTRPQLAGAPHIAARSPKAGR